jgi:hypothetical protein
LDELNLPPREKRYKMYKDKKVLVQLRLSQDEADNLRKAGEGQGRKLPSEIMHRVKNSLTGAEPELDQGLYGRDAERVARNRALGQAVGCFAARCERTVRASDDQIHDRATAMAMVRLALPLLLELLGAKDDYLTSDDRLVAHALAYDLARDLAMSAQSSALVAGRSSEAVALARIARGLSISISEWAKNILGQSISNELDKPNDREKA